MVKIARYLAYMLFFILSFLIFLPKENLYFLLEKELSKKEVFISDEVVTTSVFSLEVDSALVSYEGIEVAKIKKTKFDLYLFYNAIELNDIELSSLVSNYWPSKVQSAVVSYSVLNPLEVTAVARGSFGEIKAHYLLKESKVKVVLKPSKLILSKYRSSLRYFKKSKDGEYSYEKSL